MDRMLRDKKIIALFITPVLIIFSCLIPIPLILSLALGFFRWNLLDLPRFVGLDNFIRLFTMDDIFLQSIKNTLQYVLYTAVMQIPIAVIFAVMLTRGKRFEKLFVNLIFMPVALSGTAVTLMFYFIYNPTGVLNAALTAIGLNTLTHSWLAEEATAMAAICVKVALQFIGYHMVIYITGIANISQDLVEAAKIDGASTPQITTRIILPLLKPVALTSTVLVCVNGLKSFDSVYVMTRGGPFNATEVMASHMYNKAFLQMDYGYSAAIGAILFVLCIVVTKLLTALFQDRGFSAERKAR